MAHSVVYNRTTFANDFCNVTCAKVITCDRGTYCPLNFVKSFIDYHVYNVLRSSCLDIQFGDVFGGQC